MTVSSLYRPYGAYELKATYQRNMMIGNLTVISLFLLILGASWVTSIFQEDNEVIGSKVKLIEIDIDIAPIPTIIQEHSVYDDVKPAALPEFGIPEPVPDNEVRDEDDIVLPTRQELIEIIDNKHGPIGDGTENYIIAPIEDYIPKHDEFRPVEIYPKPIKLFQPEYPRFAEQVGIGGIAVVKVLVSTEGKVLDAIIVKSTEVEMLDEAALKAALKGIFSPGIQNGQPTPCWVSYRIEFEAP